MSKAITTTGTDPKAAAAATGTTGNSGAPAAPSRYTMTISRLTVDKLGVKLYDRVSAVIAELVANSYDADATLVTVSAPMGLLLAQKMGNTLTDKGYAIVVEDNGIGMTPEQINEFYLKVGAERRQDPKRGAESKKYRRKVMGRKGVGKLAPFGICKTIELISSGGGIVEGPDEKGNKTKGYLTAHLTLERDGILQDTDTEYHPAPGTLDGVVRPQTGTTLRLTTFAHRIVPEIADFERQLSQRFGLESANWKIELVDNQKLPTDPYAKRTVGQFSIVKTPGTELKFTTGTTSKPVTLGSDGTETVEIEPGFTLNGRFYSVTGWVAYSKDPFKDDLMAGIRVYCHGKIAAQTAIFNYKAGFHGEYDVRSYLVGEIHADWLDEEEDLIQTDRRDILWSHELGMAFEAWGQQLVLLLGKKSRAPLRMKIWDKFKEASKIEQHAKKAFPADDHSDIRDQVLQFAKVVAGNMRESELTDKDAVNDLVQLSLTFGPHITLNTKLREAAEEASTTLSALTGILKTARIAELASFGMIAEERIKVVERIESLKDDPKSAEDAFQALITQAPWLVNPQWSPVVANQTFSTLKSEFQKFYKSRTGKDLVLDDFSKPNKRCDFVMTQFETRIEIIEIKKPQYDFSDDDFERMNNYVLMMEEFFEKDTHAEFVRLFPDRYHVTLVCDGVKLKVGSNVTAFKGLKSVGTVTHIDWKVFLLRTRKMHEEFLREAERQKKAAAKP